VPGCDHEEDLPRQCQVHHKIRYRQSIGKGTLMIEDHCGCLICTLRRAINEGRATIIRIAPEPDCGWREGKNGQPVPVFVPEKDGK
jgi:hypothetical protein